MSLLNLGYTFHVRLFPNELFALYQWKAAKEELQEDEEDEPKDSYEALEKKKQREIEVYKLILSWISMVPYF